MARSREPGDTYHECTAVVFAWRDGRVDARLDCLGDLAFTAAKVTSLLTALFCAAWDNAQIGTRLASLVRLIDSSQGGFDLITKHQRMLSIID